MSGGESVKVDRNKSVRTVVWSTRRDIMDSSRLGGRSLVKMATTRWI